MSENKTKSGDFETYLAIVSLSIVHFLDMILVYISQGLTKRAGLGKERKENIGTNPAKTSFLLRLSE